MVENEFKLMLTKEQYKKILKMFEWDEVTEQTNYYFDTRTLELVEEHITCRVRAIDGRYLLQMKLPNGEEHSRIELERELSELPETISGEILEEMSGMLLPNVRRIGALTTIRHIKHEDGFEIDLDENYYLGRIDYELEVEFTDEAKARAKLKDIRMALHTRQADDVCIGKIHRFLQEYKLKNSKK